MKKIILILFLLSSFLCGQDITSSSLQKGLVLDMPLTSSYNQSATVLSDVSAYHNHGTISGNPVVGADDTDFDGTDAVTIANSFNSTFVSDFTIGLWLKPADGQPAAMQYPSGDYVDVTGRQYFVLNTNGTLKYYFMSNNDGTYITSASAVFPDGTTEWTHIMVTGDQSAGEHKMYVNGVLEATNLTGGTTAANWALYNSTTDKYYLADFDEVAGAYIGKMSNYKIWNRVLTTAEMATLYSFGTGVSDVEVDNSSAADIVVHAIEIKTLDDLQSMNADLGADYILMNNIDATPTTTWNAGTGFVPIGNYGSLFTGTFDGQDYTIDGLFIDNATRSYLGLFGYTGTGSTITDVNLTNVDITGLQHVSPANGSYSAGLVGFSSSTISGCSVSGDLVGNQKVGLLAGWFDAAGGDVSDCYTTGTVDGVAIVGGFVGESANITISDSYSTATVTVTMKHASDVQAGGFAGNSCGTVIRCYATGDVTGDDEVGGFIGTAIRTVTDCYATGDVDGDDEVGGFVGEGYGTFTNCYSSGAVTGNTNLGGLVGDDDFGSLACNDCFWDTTTSGQADSECGTGKATADMYKEATFTGWDFTDVWDIVEDTSYPTLQ